MLSLPKTLELTRRVLYVLHALNLAYGAGILVLLIATLVAPDATFGALGFQRPFGDIAAPARLIMVFGLAGAAVVYAVLVRLRAMVDTVRVGDPFVRDNARRLTTIAWAVLALEALRIVVAIVAARISSSAARQEIDITWSFSFAPWLAVLLLFVLARVFEHGTRMRSDLEGTV